jgi:hypothetical protein
MTQGMEKRKFYRLPYPLDVVVEIVTAAETPRDVPAVHLHSRNISKEGICLETDALEWNSVSLIAGAPCARENRLRMTLQLEPAGPSLTVTGEVRWYDVVRDEGGCLYQLGIEFLDFREGGKEQLFHFLKSRQHKGIIQRLFK